jgi:hypothetical protein
MTYTEPRSKEAVRLRVERAIEEDGPISTSEIRSLFGSIERRWVRPVLKELVDEGLAEPKPYEPAHFNETGGRIGIVYTKKENR